MAVYSGSLLLAAQPSSSLFLLLEQIKGREFSPHERILNTTNHASGAMLVPYPEGKEFESGHDQLCNCRLESRQRVRKTLSISLLPNSAMVAASLKKRCSQGGYLIRVVVMALDGEVT